MKKVSVLRHVEPAVSYFDYLQRRTARQLYADILAAFAESAYVDWDEVESEWFKNCHEKMTWLDETIEKTREITVIKLHLKLQAQVDDLKPS